MGQGYGDCRLDTACAPYLCCVRHSHRYDSSPPDIDFHIFSVNNSMRGQWAALATDETGSLVIQVCFMSPSLSGASHPSLVDDVREHGGR